MSNKYLEKIAGYLPLAGLTGAISSKKGDTIGGAVTGELAGIGAVRTGAKLGLKGIPSLLTAYVGGGYLGGKAYSKAKDSLKTRKIKK